MDRVERICDRLPRFYKHRAKDSVIFSLIRAVSRHLDEAEEKITDSMKAHWIDTAVEDKLDKLGVLLGLSRLSGEDDLQFKARLKRAVNEYKGGGTITAILDAVKALVRAQSEEDVEIVENPRASGFAEFTVRAGDEWTLGSNSITDAQPSLTLTVEEGGGVSNPQIMNLDTGESITLKGKLKSGQKLVMKKKKASIDEKDVSGRISPQKIPRLLRKDSTWKYTEALEKLIGVFDTAKFDEHTFAVGVPSVKIRFDWTRLQPATFEVRIKSKALRDSGFSKPYLEKVVNSMKAGGVNAVIKVSG
ncbi:MAG: hypothetical protein ACE5IF_05530 [Candidatus Bathyarchaeia archaeon]